MTDPMFDRLAEDQLNGHLWIAEADHLKRLPEYGDYFDGQAAVAQRQPSRLARVAQNSLNRSELDRVPRPTWQVDGVMTRASLTLLTGKFGTYKSFVAVALAASVATGVPFLGREVPEQGPVIYIAAEGLSGMGPRYQAWESVHLGGAMIPDDRLTVVGGAVHILNGADMHGLRDLCRRVGPRLIVWDTLHRCAPGVDENSSQESGRVVDTLASLRDEFGCTQLVCHHTGHGGVRARGSSSWEDDFDNAWVIKLGGDGEDRSANVARTMEHRKVKDGDLSEPIPIHLVSAGESAYVDRKTVAAKVPRTWLVVKAHAATLDQAGVPLKYGRVRVAEALKELGIKVFDHNMASDIATLRKSPDYRPAEVSASASVLSDADEGASVNAPLLRDADTFAKTGGGHE